MKSIRVCIAAAAVALSGIAVAPAYSDETPVREAPLSYEEAAALYETFRTAYENDRYPEAQTAGTALSQSSLFAAQSQYFRQNFWLQLAHARSQVGDEDGAAAAYREADALTNSPSFSARLNIRALIHDENWNAAHREVLQLAARNPASFNNLGRWMFVRINYGLTESGQDAERLELLSTVLNQFRFDDPFLPPEPLRLDFARLLAEAGRYDEAWEQVGLLETADSLSHVRSELVFSSFWAREDFFSRTNVRRAKTNEAARWAELTEAYPHRLWPVIQHIVALTALGDHEQADRVARTAVNRLDNGHEYTDAGLQARWLFNYWGYALYAMGRVEDGDAALRRASRSLDGTGCNVCNTINLAEMQILQGRYEDALVTLDEVVGIEATQDKHMWHWANRVCAYHYLGDTAARDEYLPLLAENWREQPAAYQTVALCMNDEELGAQILIDRLEDERFWADALRAIQRNASQFDNDRMPHTRDWDEAFETLINRPDVRAAIDRVGFIWDSDLEAFGPY